MTNRNFLLKSVIAGVYLASFSLFFYLRHTIFPLVTVKVFSFHIIIEALLILWLILLYFHREFRSKFQKLDYILLSLMGVIFLSGVFGVDSSRSFWSIPARGIGVFSLLHFTALFIILRSLKNHFNWRKYLGFLFFLSLAMSLIAVWQRFLPGHLFQIISQSTSRPGSLLGNPSFLALYLIFTVFIGFYLGLSEKNKALKSVFLTGSFIEVIVIFFTATRGAILGLILGFVWALFLFAYKQMKERKKFLKNIPAIILLALFVFGLVFVSTNDAQIWQSVSGLDRLANISFDDVTTKNRLITWGTAWQSFLDKPILGWGWENFKYGFDANYNTKLLSTGINETFWDKPHNVFFEYLSTTGIVGFILYLAFLVGLFFTVLKKRGYLGIFGSALILAYVVSNSFIFDTFGSYLMLFILTAFVLKEEDEEKAEAKVGKSPLFLGGIVIFSVVSLYFIFVNIQIVRANNLQYHGLNFILNELPEEGIESYRQAIKIVQPYQDQIRLSFLEAIGDTVLQFDLPNIDELMNEAIKGANIVAIENPIDYRTHIILAEAKTKFSDINPAFAMGIAEDVEKAIQLSPNRQENYYALSQALLRNGDREGAYATMEKAINLDETVGEPHFYYGLLALQLGDNETGWREIQLAESLGRTAQLGHEFRILANFYGDAENYQKAIEYYNSAISINPLDFEAKLKLGIVHYYVDEFDKAKVLFEEVLTARPDFVGSANYQSLVPIFVDVGVL